MTFQSRLQNTNSDLHVDQPADMANCWAVEKQQAGRLMGAAQLHLLICYRISDYDVLCEASKVLRLSPCLQCGLQASPYSSFSRRHMGWLPAY